MAAALNLSVEVLDWAAEKAGESRESLAHAIAKRKTDREKILGGELTVRQVEKIAKRARVPFGYLFLATPPQIAAPRIPDLRQTVNAAPLSTDFFEVLEDVIRKQQWFIEHLSSMGTFELPFVGKFDLAKNPAPTVIAADMRQTLALTARDRGQCSDASAYFGLIAARAEEVGVLVMKNGVVRSNSRRALSENEFRGFALSHPSVPVVFVNGQDAEVAAVFTLAHELAHIWLGVSGVSDIPTASERAIERLCNAVAGELLVPQDEFLAQWANSQVIENLARYFRVSRLVVARRALDLGRIDQGTYDIYAKTNVRPARGRGGDGLRNVRVRNSKRFTNALVSSAMSGQTLLREAAGLLNVQPDTVMKLGGERFAKNA